MSNNLGNIATVLGGTALGGLFSRQEAPDFSGAINTINQGRDRAVGNGSPTGGGYVQQWTDRGINNYVTPGLNQTSWAGDAQKSWLGGNGADAQAAAYNGFANTGAAAARRQLLSQTQATAAGAQGRSNSGAADAALARAQVGNSFAEEQAYGNNLFRQQQMGGQYANMGLNANQQGMNAVTGIDISANNAIAGLNANQAMASTAASNANNNGFRDALGAGMKMIGSFI